MVSPDIWKTVVSLKLIPAAQSAPILMAEIVQSQEIYDERR